MKRDIELIKKILLTIESHEERFYPISSVKSEEVFSVDEKTLWMHIRLLSDYNLVYKSDIDCMNEFSYALTWQGFDFLDDSRNPTVWEAAKKIAGKSSIGTFMFALKSGAAEAVAIAVRNALGVGG